VFAGPDEGEARRVPFDNKEKAQMDSTNGDPAAMQAHAAKLRQAAETVQTHGRKLDHKVDSTHFEGAAANRFRAAMAERSARARTAADRLNDLAERVQARAADSDQHPA
jgi:uncharacterized protein YukE